MNRLPARVPVVASGAVLVAAALAAAVCLAESASPSPASPFFVYFGTYTNNPKSKGVYVSTFDPATGALGAPRLAAESRSPSFLALHPSRPLLYAVNEVDDFGGEKAGSVSAFAVDPLSGDLRLLGAESSRGAHPCHLDVDGGGRHVLVANYSGGNVASLPLKADGSLGPATSVVQHTGSSVNERRQKGPHAHQVETDPSNRFAFAADLGLDQVLVYRFDADKGGLVPADPPHARVAPGSGPRHFAFSPDGRFLYVLNEMLITVTTFRHDQGRLSEVETVPAMPAGREITPADSGAEIVVHPGGRFVYASLRGPDSLAVFARDGKTGKLTLAEHVSTGGKTPRSFGIDPSGRWLLAGNQRSDSVVVFRIDPGTGRLTATGPAVEVGAPVSVVFFRTPARR